MSGACILLVEDNAVLCDLLRRNLEARAHQVAVAADACTAVQCLRRDQFDLVILDINLPDQTGWDVLRIAGRERSLPATTLDTKGAPCLPVVVISAVRVSLARFQEFPVLAYLPKPFPMDALLRLVSETAQRKQNTIEWQQAERSGSISLSIAWPDS